MRWRKATWAILIWTGLNVLFYVTNITAEPEYGWLLNDEERVRAFEDFSTFWFIQWGVGSIILTVVWFMSRPKQNTTIYGPQGQQVVVTEKEAKKRVEQEGWTYQPPQPQPQQQDQGHQPPHGEPPELP